MKIQTEKLTIPLCFEILPLLDEAKEYAYEKESSLYKKMITDDKVKTNVDFDYYLYMQKHDKLHITTLRNDENELVGHFTLTISNHVQCTDLVVANTQNVIVSEKYRSYSIIKQMFKHTEEELKKIGVEVIYLGVDHKSRINKLFQKLGYKTHEIIYTKEI